MRLAMGYLVLFSFMECRRGLFLLRLLGHREVVV